MIKPKFTHNTLRWGLLSVALACIASMPVWADDAPDSGEDLVPEPIFPADITVGEATYTVDLVNPADTFAGLNITGYAATGTELLIPAELTIPEKLHPGQLVLPVAAVNIDEACNLEDFTEIRIEDSDVPLTLYNDLGLRTFVETLYLGRNIINGDGLNTAFGGNLEISSLVNNVTFGKNVTAIPDSAFMYCLDLKNPNLPDSLLSIGQKSFAFSDSRAFTAIKFPKTLKTIDKYAFYNCDRLTSIVFSDTVESIEEYAFAAIDNIENVDILANTVKPYAFDSCTKLTNISVRGNGSVEHAAFGNCTVLDSAYIDCPTIGTLNPNLNQFKQPEDWQVLVGNKSLRALDLGDNVKIVEAYAFYGCPIKQLNIGKRIEHIKSFALSGGGALKELIFPSDTVPNPVIILDANAFYLAKDAVVSLGNRMKYVGSLYAQSIAKLDLGNSVQEIYNIPVVEQDSLVIPASVIKTDKFGYSLYGVNKKIIIEASDTPLQLGSMLNPISRENPIKVSNLVINRKLIIWFSDTAGLLSKRRGLFSTEYIDTCQIGIDPRATVDLPKYLFYDTSTTSKVDSLYLHIGPMVRNINTQSLYWYYAKNIDLVIDEGVENIAKSAYSIRGTYKNKSLVLPASLESVDIGGFTAISPLDITFKASKKPITVTSSSTSKFDLIKQMYIDRPISDDCAADLAANFPNLEKVVFGDNVREIPANMFNGVTGLKHVIVSDSVQSIGAAAFQGCTGLSILSLSENLTTIGEDAYKDCTGFERVVARGLQPASGAAGFGADVTDIVPLYVPKDALNKYKRSTTFKNFAIKNPFGEDVATDVVVDEETPEAQEYVDALDESEPGTTVGLPTGGIGVIVQPIYEEDYNEIPKARAKAASSRAVAPELYWVSLDPTVASVDQQGNVTINKKAPVEIRAYLLDGSDKYASFGVNQPALLGDLNRDKVVNSADINMIVNHVAAPEGSTVKLKVADMNGDGEINAADINMLIQQCAKTEE